MKKLLFGLLLLPMFAFIGCDQESSHEKHEVKTEDGTVITEEKKVTENDEGDKTVTETHEVNRP